MPQAKPITLPSGVTRARARGLVDAARATVQLRGPGVAETVAAQLTEAHRLGARG